MNSWIVERMQCKRSLQWLKTLIWSSLFQLFFYNSNIKSTIRIVIQHPLIYEPITDEFVIRWGRSSRFFTRLGANFIILYFTTAHYCHSKFMETWIGLMIILLAGIILKPYPWRVSLDLYVDSGSVWLKVPLPKNNQTFYTC